MENDNDVPPPPQRRVPTEKGLRQTAKARSTIRKGRPGSKGNRTNGKVVHREADTFKNLWHLLKDVPDPSLEDLAKAIERINFNGVARETRSHILFRRKERVSSDNNVDLFLATLKERVKEQDFLDKLEKKVQKEEPEPEEATTTITCPITQEAMKDPVCAADGQTYEREAIERWLQHKGTSPFTRQQISSEVYPNIAVRNL